MLETYATRCTTCRFFVRGDWPTVKAAAQEHEANGHQVQLTPSSGAVAPLPRGMWAAP